MRATSMWRDKYDWHHWFVWYPIWVHTAHCKGMWVWLERVQRKYEMTYDGVSCLIRNLDGSEIQ